MATIAATWTELSTQDALQRSSHSLASTGGKLYVFGGELAPREPRDNEVYEIDVANSNNLKAVTFQDAQTKPTARVGATMTAIKDKLYVFSGRGGVAMAPIDEGGALHVFDTKTSTWTSLASSDTSMAVPEPRSYHCATTDGDKLIFIHAGCPEKGRLNDLWSFNVISRQWTQHSDAPAAPRGGSSITFSDGKLWRMNGFDGKTEIGGMVDVYDIAGDFWSTVNYTADGKSGPGARSVSALLSTTIEGQIHLVTMFGEADPSSLGHAGAGKMLNDAWAFNTHTEQWRKLEAKTSPQPRGWFDASVVGEGKIAVTGGLADSNERISDAWLLTIA